ncbi:MAG: hypothetical protein H6807_16260 [Planctomycetes bacterium]|nr:hypothetical protein [Planctomycetota bacterium]
MRILILSLALAVVAACANQEKVPLRTDGDGFQAAWLDFESAWSELEVAVRSTPRWEMDRAMTERVDGLAGIARDRAERLAAWDGSGLVSRPAIDLILAEIERTSGHGPEGLPLQGADVVTEVGVQRRAFDQERAWQAISDRLPWLEAYAAAAVPSPWLERRVFPRDLAAMDLIFATRTEDLGQWRRLRVDEADLAAMQDRLGTLPMALGGELERR